MPSMLHEKLESFIAQTPFFAAMGIEFSIDEKDNLLFTWRYSPNWIGNPLIPALHGGGTAAFLEAVGAMSLMHEAILPRNPDHDIQEPKTINLTVDYLRSGQAKDSFAKAEIIRAGRRYATARIIAWQEAIDKPFAVANAQFLMPQTLTSTL